MISYTRSENCFIDPSNQMGYVLSLLFFFLLLLLFFPIQAYVAKLETSITITSDKLELKLYGFNDKLAVLLSKIISVLHYFSPKLDRFKVFLIYFELPTICVILHILL